MLAHLLDVSIRSLLLALPAIFFIRRPAALQHAVWTTVVCGMLALSVFGQLLPRLPIRILHRPGAPATLSAAPTQSEITLEPGQAPPLHLPTHPAPRAVDWTRIALYAYAAIALVFLARLAAGMFLVRRLIANSRAAARQETGFLESDLIAIPLTVGWLRPRILLPTEWREWPPAKLEAVLAHEGAHARRRDALVAALAAVNRSIFWFHPLAWFLERKLALLAEQACDEYSVAALGDRDTYAKLLLEMARTAGASHGRLRRHALAMAAPSHIRRRIDSLLEEGRTFSRGLTRPARTAIALCAIPLLFAAGAAELATPQATPAAQAQAAPAPKFEVASIKRCTEDQTAVRDAAGAKGGAKGGGRGGGNSSPDTLDLPCLPVRLLIQLAYFDSDRRLNPESTLSLDAGTAPSWIDSERYSIVAKANGPVGRAIMQGPMLQALLEDRFKLKLRPETRETAIYALAVASGGLKLQKPDDLSCTEPDAGGPARAGKRFTFIDCSKLQRAQEGDCTPRDLTQVPPPPLNPDDMPPCGVPRGLVSLSSSRRNTDVLGATMTQIARHLGGAAGRPVIDNTGLTGKFNIHLEFAAADAEPSDDPSAAPSIFSVLPKLGLKLEPTKGPRDFLVLDHIERPTEN